MHTLFSQFFFFFYNIMGLIVSMQFECILLESEASCQMNGSELFQFFSVWYLIGNFD